MSEVIVSNVQEKIFIEADKDVVVVTESEAVDIIIDVNSAIITSSAQAPDIFTPTNGQTVFTLSLIPVGTLILTLRVFLNGQKLVTGSYSISGSQLTIILPYSLASNDILEVFY